MPSMQTIFRAVVMVGIGVVSVKAWHLYGPTNEQVKKVADRVVEFVQSYAKSGQSTASTTDPRLVPHTNELNSNGAPAISAPPLTMPAPPLVQTEAPKLLPEANPSAGLQMPAPISTPTTNTAATPVNAGDRVNELISKLQKLGAADTNLAAWGGDGKLFRFSCRAPLASSPLMTKHFESVAAEPALAVEEVLAKVETWQVAQREIGQARY